MNAPQPMLATVASVDDVELPCLVQPKLNGIRALYVPAEKAFYTRHGKRWNDCVVAHLVEQMKGWPVEYVYDGEFYVHGWSLQQINSAIAVTRTEPALTTPSIEYWIFDRIAPLGFCDRYFPLIQAQLHTQSIKLVATIVVEEKLAATRDALAKRGFEGLMVRDITTPYEAGRSNSLRKIKFRETYDYEIIGVKEGNGRNKGRLGAFVCYTNTFARFLVGSGHFTDAQRDEFWANPPIGKTLTLRTEAGFSDDGIPLQAQFVCIRDYEG